MDFAKNKKRRKCVLHGEKYELLKKTSLTWSKIYPVIPYTFQDDTPALPYPTLRELYSNPTLEEGRVG